jgi:hypothetical protein
MNEIITIITNKLRKLIQSKKNDSNNDSNNDIKQQNINVNKNKRNKYGFPIIK